MLFGAGFCTLEAALFVVRFGFGDRDISTAGPVVWVPLLFGLVLFFAGGLLVGLFAQWNGARAPTARGGPSCLWRLP